MRFRILFLFLLVSVVSKGVAQNSKTSQVRQLLALQHSEQEARTAVTQLLQVIKKQKPNVPENYWSTLASQIQVGPFVESLVPIYEKYYTPAQLQTLIHYYQKPTGNVPVQPSTAMEKEIYQAGNQFGQQTGQWIVQKLRQDGY